jgi:hypothetical protein
VFLITSLKGIWGVSNAWLPSAAWSKGLFGLAPLAHSHYTGDTAGASDRTWRLFVRRRPASSATQGVGVGFKSVAYLWSSDVNGRTYFPDGAVKHRFAHGYPRSTPASSYPVSFCWLLLSCGSIYRLMVKSVSRECHGSCDMRIDNGGSNLCVVAELARWFLTQSSGIEHGCDNTGEVWIFVSWQNWLGDSWLEAAAPNMGATIQEKFKFLLFRMKIQGLALVGCVWQWPCSRHFFVSEDFLQGESLRSMIGWWWHFYTVFFLKALLL